MGEGQHVEEAELCEGSRLDLFHAVVVQMQLLQGGEPVKGLLQSDMLEGRGKKKKNTTLHFLMSLGKTVLFKCSFLGCTLTHLKNDTFKKHPLSLSSVFSSHLVKDVNFVVSQV